MTAPIMDGVGAVLARISAIQQQLAPLDSSYTGAVTPTRTSGTAFANTLARAVSAPAAAPNPSGTVNGVTYSPGSQNVTGADIVRDAESYLGVPYVFAGTTRSGMDCSGLVQTTYKDLGMSLPRISWQQQKVGTAVPSLAQAQPGDVLCFGDPAYHVAIYIGNGKMIQAPEPGKNVEIADVSPPPSSIRRIVGASAPAAVTGLTGVTGLPGVTGAGLTGVTGTGVTGTAHYPSDVAQYASLFSAAEARYGLPAGMLGAFAHVESGGNPNAVSPAGAQGLMQLMPGTASSLGVANPFDPAQAVDGAARMLAGLMQRYHNSITLAAAAYNAGAGAVDEYGGVPPYPETQNYVVKIKQAMGGGG